MTRTTTRTTTPASARSTTRASAPATSEAHCQLAARRPRQSGTRPTGTPSRPRTATKATTRATGPVAYAELPVAADQAAFLPDGQVPLLLELLSAHCSADQTLRELVVNGFEAIAAVPAWRRGQPRLVLVTPETVAGVAKLSVIDTGVGMDRRQLLGLRELMTSSKAQGLTANFGIGARLTTAHTSPFGTVYRSWQGPTGYEITMRWEGGRVGLAQYPDGRPYRELRLAAAPEAIRATGHGTQVVLLGTSGEEDTWAADPTGRYPSRQLAALLERRFATVPRGVELAVAEAAHRRAGLVGSRSTRRRVKGAVAHLTQQATEHGTVEAVTSTGTFTVEWWMVTGTARHTHAPLSTVAFRHGGELLDRAEGAAAERRLRSFGLAAIAGRMTLHVHPHGTLTQDVSRTHHQVDGHPVSWEAIGEAFADQIPEALAEAIKAKRPRRARRNEDRYRTAKYQGLFPLVARLVAGGTVKPPKPVVDPDEGSEPTPPEQSHTDPGGPRGSRAPRPKVPQAQMGLGLPTVEVSWISTEDGTRDEGELEGFAGRFEPEAQLIVMNRDWAGFASMREWVTDRLMHHHEPKKALTYRNFGRITVAAMVTAELEYVYGQAVIEAVVFQLAAAGVDATAPIPEALAEALNPMAITMVVCERTNFGDTVFNKIGVRTKGC